MATVNLTKQDNRTNVSVVKGTISESVMIGKHIDDISNHVGSDHTHTKIRNSSGSTITKGTIVAFDPTVQSGTDYIEVLPMTNSQTQIACGVAVADVLNGNTGLILNKGVLENIDTSLLSVGLVYPTDTGGFTNTTPNNPTLPTRQVVGLVFKIDELDGQIFCDFTSPYYYASTTIYGMTILSDNLITNNSQMALTAKQGKVLQDNKSDISHTHSGVYEPSFTKNTGFNKDLGTTAGTVSEGDHNHAGIYEPADATILKEADKGVTVQVYDAATVKSDSVTTFTATQTFLGISETVTVKSASFTPNLATEGTIFNVEGPALVTMPAAQIGKSFIIRDAASFIVGWGNSPAIRWEDGVVPTYIERGLLVFECIDGLNWDGQMVGSDYATV